MSVVVAISFLFKANAAAEMFYKVVDKIAILQARQFSMSYKTRTKNNPIATRVPGDDPVIYSESISP